MKKIDCRQCGKSYAYDPSYLGDQSRCPGCAKEEKLKKS